MLNSVCGDNIKSVTLGVALFEGSFIQTLDIWIKVVRRMGLPAGEPVYNIFMSASLSHGTLRKADIFV